MKRIEIEWAQTVIERAFVSKATALLFKEESFARVAIGFLLLETDDRYIICGSYRTGPSDKETSVEHTLLIPKKCVISITYLKSEKGDDVN